MTATTFDSALPARPSPWASRVSVAAVHFFVLVLFLQNMQAHTWAAILGLVLAHVYSVLILIYWSRLERSTAGDTVIVQGRCVRCNHRIRSDWICGETFIARTEHIKTSPSYDFIPILYQ